MQKQLVFLHGWGMNKAVWQLCQQTLATDKSLQIQALNLPGFGGEALPTSGFSITACAEQLAEQLPDHSILVGWSLGGLFALYLAHHYPHKVSKVVLVCASPYFCQSSEWPGIKPDVLANFATQLQRDSNKTIERFLAIQAMGSEHAREDIKQLRQLLASLPAPQQQALAGGLNMLQSLDLRVVFSELKQPVAGVFGRLDSLVPAAVVDDMHKLNANFRAHVMAKASHAPFISHKDDFISLLKTII